MRIKFTRRHRGYLAGQIIDVSSSQGRALLALGIAIRAPEAVVPEAVVPEAVVPEAVIPEAVIPEAVAPEAVTETTAMTPARGRRRGTYAASSSSTSSDA